MNIYSIYKITNIISNQSYIGFTVDFKKRIKQHIKNAEKYPNKTNLYHDLKKLGISNFTTEILYQSKERLHTLKEMETFFIKKYKTHISQNGYNLTWGGDCGHKNNVYNGFEYVLVSPKGEKFKTTNIREFSRENKLHDSSIFRVINGLSNHYKGWKAYGLSEYHKQKRNENLSKRLSPKWQIITPDKKIYKEISLEGFCKSIINYYPFDGSYKSMARRLLDISRQKTSHKLYEQGWRVQKLSE